MRHILAALSRTASATIVCYYRRLRSSFRMITSHGDLHLTGYLADDLNDIVARSTTKWGRSRLAVLRRNSCRAIWRRSCSVPDTQNLFGVLPRSSTLTADLRLPSLGQRRCGPAPGAACSDRSPATGVSAPLVHGADSGRGSLLTFSRLGCTAIPAGAPNHELLQLCAANTSRPAPSTLSHSAAATNAWTRNAVRRPPMSVNASCSNTVTSPTAHSGCRTGRASW